MRRNDGVNLSFTSYQPVSPRAPSPRRRSPYEAPGNLVRTAPLCSKRLAVPENETEQQKLVRLARSIQMEINSLNSEVVPLRDRLRKHETGMDNKQKKETLNREFLGADLSKYETQKQKAQKVVNKQAEFSDLVQMHSELQERFTRSEIGKLAVELDTERRKWLTQIGICIEMDRKIQKRKKRIAYLMKNEDIRAVKEQEVQIHELRAAIIENISEHRRLKAEYAKLKGDEPELRERGVESPGALSRLKSRLQGANNERDNAESRYREVLESQRAELEQFKSEQMQSYERDLVQEREIRMLKEQQKELDKSKRKSSPRRQVRRQYNPEMSKKTVWIGTFDYRVAMSTVAEMCAGCGTIQDVEIVRDDTALRAIGFAAIVTFGTHRSAENAIVNLNGAWFENQRLVAEWYEPLKNVYPVETEEDNARKKQASARASARTKERSEKTVCEPEPKRKCRSESDHGVKEKSEAAVSESSSEKHEEVEDTHKSDAGEEDKERVSEKMAFSDDEFLDSNASAKETQERALSGENKENSGVESQKLSHEEEEEKRSEKSEHESGKQSSKSSSSSDNFEDLDDDFLEKDEDEEKHEASERNVSEHDKHESGEEHKDKESSAQRSSSSSSDAKFGDLDEEFADSSSSEEKHEENKDSEKLTPFALQMEGKSSDPEKDKKPESEGLKLPDLELNLKSGEDEGEVKTREVPEETKLSDVQMDIADAMTKNLKVNEEEKETKETASDKESKKSSSSMELDFDNDFDSGNEKKSSSEKKSFSGSEKSVKEDSKVESDEEHKKKSSSSSSSDSEHSQRADAEKKSSGGWDEDFEQKSESEGNDLKLPDVQLNVADSIVANLDEGKENDEVKERTFEQEEKMESPAEKSEKKLSSTSSSSSGENEKRNGENDLELPEIQLESPDAMFSNSGEHESDHLIRDRSAEGEKENAETAKEEKKDSSSAKGSSSSSNSDHEKTESEAEKNLEENAEKKSETGEEDLKLPDVQLNVVGSFVANLDEVEDDNEVKERAIEEKKENESEHEKKASSAGKKSTSSSDSETSVKEVQKVESDPEKNDLKLPDIQLNVADSVVANLEEKKADELNEENAEVKSRGLEEEKKASEAEKQPEIEKKEDSDKEKRDSSSRKDSSSSSSSEILTTILGSDSPKEQNEPPQEEVTTKSEPDEKNDLKLPDIQLNVADSIVANIDEKKEDEVKSRGLEEEQKASEAEKQPEIEKKEDSDKEKRDSSSRKVSGSSSSSEILTTILGSDSPKEENAPHQEEVTTKSEPEEKNDLRLPDIQLNVADSVVANLGEKKEDEVNENPEIKSRTVEEGEKQPEIEKKEDSDKEKKPSSSRKDSSSSSSSEILTTILGSDSPKEQNEPPQEEVTTKSEPEEKNDLKLPDIQLNVADSIVANIDEKKEDEVKSRGLEEEKKASEAEKQPEIEKKEDSDKEKRDSSSRKESNSSSSSEFLKADIIDSDSAKEENAPHQEEVTTKSEPEEKNDLKLPDIQLNVADSIVANIDEKKEEEVKSRAVEEGEKVSEKDPQPKEASSKSSDHGKKSSSSSSSDSESKVKSDGANKSSGGWDEDFDN